MKGHCLTHLDPSGDLRRALGLLLREQADGTRDGEGGVQERHVEVTAGQLLDVVFEPPERKGGRDVSPEDAQQQYIAISEMLYINMNM